MQASQLKYKVPPHNAEAEQATLGALLLDPEAVPQVLRYLRPDDFYVNAYKHVFTAIVSLFEKGQKSDIITLVDEMRALALLDLAGGIENIAKLTDAVPSSANIEYYAKIVQEYSIRRKLIKLAADMISKAHDDSIEINILLDELEERIFDVSENKQIASYRSLKEVVPETMKFIEAAAKSKNKYSGVPCGFSELDSMTSGFQNSELIIIGARPSMGKTAFALNMASNMASKGYPVCFFSLEMSDISLTYRLLSSDARVNAEKVKIGAVQPKDISKLMDSASRMYEAPMYLVDVPNIKLLDLRSLARRLKSEQNIKVIFIDYITLITHENSSLPRWEQIASISRSLKSLARELSIPIIALSQLKREAEGKHAPSLADLSESGSIEQDADLIMFLHREREFDKTKSDQSISTPTDLIIAKHRNGRVGKVELLFFSSYTRFEMLEKGP